MPTISSLPDTTPPVAPGPASFSRRGCCARGRPAPRGTAARRGQLAEGDLIFTTAATGWGEILTDPVVRRPDRGPHPSDGRQLPDRPVRPRIGPGPRPRAGRDPARHAARRPRPLGRGAPRGGRHPGHRGHRHASPDPRAATGRGPAGRHPLRRTRTFERAVPMPTLPGVGGGRSRGGGRAQRGVPARAGTARAAVGRCSSTTGSSAPSSRADRARPRGHRSATGRLRGRRGGPRPGPRRPLPGPGDPSRMAPQIATVADLLARATAGGPPLLGICLGHQLLGLAAGAPTRAWRWVITAATTGSSRRPPGG